MVDFRARLHGIDAWANLRLCADGGEPAEPNILNGLFQGSTMKRFLELIMGKPMRKMTSFDGLSKQQKVMRADWFVSGLQESGFLSKNHRVDKEYFISSFGDEVFPVLWSVVNYDIKYSWCVCPDMMSSSPDVLLAKPLTLMTGESPHPVVQTSLAQRRVSRPVKPDAEDCLFSLARSLLKATREGSKLKVEELSDFNDCRILCALVNALVPEMFTSEILLNDRWTLNLIVKCLRSLFRLEISFDSQDFAEVDEIGLCSFMAVFFLRGFQLRQSLAVMAKLDHFEKKITKAESDLKDIPSPPKTAAHINRTAELKTLVEDCKDEISRLGQKFNLNECRSWSESIEELQQEIRDDVSQMVDQRFDVVDVADAQGPGMTINDFVDELGINLVLTGMVGFYTTGTQEVVYPGRRLVVQDTKTGEFYDNFTGHENSDGRSVYDVLHITAAAVSTVRPDAVEGCKVFFESKSRNRILREDTLFLYQVFPGTLKSSEHILLHAAQLGNEEIVKKLALFFNFESRFLNCRDPSTGNTPLHLVARHGYQDLVLYFLENGAKVNSLNDFGNTALFLAAERINKPICQLLLEWGCKSTIKNNNSNTVCDVINNVSLKSLIAQYAIYYKMLRTSLATEEQLGNPSACREVLRKVIAQHQDETDAMTFVTLTSRCVNGQTLLHTAAALNDVKSCKILLDAKVPFDILDSKDRTPLHCTTSPEIVQLLLQAGAPVDQLDKGGSSPLHSVCNMKQSDEQLECIKELLAAGADVAVHNDEGLMPLHHCAAFGNTDAIAFQLSLSRDYVTAGLASQEHDKLPSPVSYALENVKFDCANWLAEEGMDMKPNEGSHLLMNFFGTKHTSSDQFRLVEFLVKRDKVWDINMKLDLGYRPIHLACGNAMNYDSVELMLENGADVTLVEDRGRTALHMAAQSNSPYSAALLIRHGASVYAKDKQGLSPLDMVPDYSEWVTSGHFDEDTIRRLSVYDMKQSRHLIRAISSTVQQSLDRQPPHMHRHFHSHNPHGQDLHELRTMLAASTVRTTASPMTAVLDERMLLASERRSRTERRGVTEATAAFPMPAFKRSKSHDRTLSAPATVSTTKLPPIGKLKPRSRQIVKSVVGI
eukprot:scpid18435/ scgid19114/ Ankyrin-2; Ankyrin-B; Brain ankyrin; Non-erythroid ankyrin